MKSYRAENLSIARVTETELHTDYKPDVAAPAAVNGPHTGPESVHTHARPHQRENLRTLLFHLYGIPIQFHEIFSQEKK